MIGHDLLAQGVSALQGVMGQSFRVDGINTTFTGVFNRHQYTETLVVGGYEESVDAEILASKSQFSGVWTPNRGKRVFVLGKVFQIVGVTEDAWSYTLTLGGVNK